MQRWSISVGTISVVTIAFGVSLLALPSAHAADSCQPVFDALTKVATTPSHSYTTTTSARAPKPQDTETIMTGGKKYIRVNGRWMTAPVTTAQVLEQEQAREKTSKATCQLVKSESVGAEPTSVYSMHREGSGVTEDAQFWISKSSGQALRAEGDMNMGGEIGKEHRSSHFEYSNVAPPM